MKVIAAEFARRVGVNRSQITRLTEEGVLRADSKGKYDLAENLAAWKRREEGKQQGQKITTATGALRAKYLAVKIKSVELDNEQTEGRLVSLADAKRTVTMAFHAVKSKLLGLPGQVAPLLIGLQPAQAEKLLRDKITQALKELSEHEWIQTEETSASRMAQQDQGNQTTARP
jgi:hypothetical protein